MTMHYVAVERGTHELPREELGVESLFLSYGKRGLIDSQTVGNRGRTALKLAAEKVWCDPNCVRILLRKFGLTPIL